MKIATPADANAWIKLALSLGAAVVFATMMYMKVEASEQADLIQDESIEEFKKWIIKQESFNNQALEHLKRSDARSEKLLEHLLKGQSTAN